MEKLEVQHICKNLHKLVELTNCNSILLAKLQSANVLTEEEIQRLKSTQSRLDRAYDLYELLQTRKNAYSALMKALAQGCQFGSYEILKSINKDNEHISLEKYEYIDHMHTTVGIGRFQNRKVAVKVYPRDFENINIVDLQQEIETLSKQINHPNVSAFVSAEIHFTDESEYGKSFPYKDYPGKKDSSGNYEKTFGRQLLVASEFCDISLYEWVNTSGRTQPLNVPSYAYKRKHSLNRNWNIDKYPISKIDVMKQITKGIHHLHSLGIAHGRLHPGNILLSANSQLGKVEVKVAGVRTSIMRSSSFFSDSHSFDDWEPSDARNKGGLEQPKKSEFSSDVFCLGCVFYFVISNGQHPFGREYKTIRNAINFNHKTFQISQINPQYHSILPLVFAMIFLEPKNRPSTEGILSYVSFWSAEMALSFLEEIDNFLQKDCDEARKYIKAIERKRSLMIPRICSTWAEMTSPAISKYLKEVGVKSESVTDLAIAVCKMKLEYKNLQGDVQKTIGGLSDAFYNYWNDKFPLLFFTLWIGAVEVEKFQNYFTGIPFLSTWLDPQMESSMKEVVYELAASQLIKELQLMEDKHLDGSKLEYLEYNEIAKGPNHTIVYKGRFGSIKVATKRINSCYLFPEKNTKDMNLLLALQYCPYIAHYFHFELNEDFLLIGTELCLMPLSKWITLETKVPKIPLIEVLRQAGEGLAYLHDNDVTHGNIKPENIMISMFDNLKLTDYGVLRKPEVENGMLSVNTVTGRGTFGWLAPELVKSFENLSDQHLKPIATKESDVFALGCIFYYVLSGGGHPFGDDFVSILKNIRSGDACQNFTHLEGFDGFMEIVILSMVANKPAKRLNIASVLLTPMFWSHEKIYSFFCQIMVVPRSKGVCAEFESKMQRIVGQMKGFWVDQISPNVRKNMKETNNTWTGLLDTIKELGTRNMLPEEVRKEFKEYQHYILFWTARFPLLFIVAWNYFRQFKTDKDYGLANFYEVEDSFSQKVGKFVDTIGKNKEHKKLVKQLERIKLLK